MQKESVSSVGGHSPRRDAGSQNEEGKVLVCLQDEHATKVSCDILKYLSMKGIHTYFVDKQDYTSFRALYCKQLGFSVGVKEHDVAVSGHTVNFFLNDATGASTRISTDEQPWRVMGSEGEVCKIEPLISFDEEIKVRAIASNAFNALKSAFSKKAKAELHELYFQFGRPTAGHWAGKLVLTGTITSKECQVTWNGSVKTFEQSDFYLSKLTEKLFS